MLTDQVRKITSQNSDTGPGLPSQRSTEDSPLDLPADPEPGVKPKTGNTGKPKTRNTGKPSMTEAVGELAEELEMYAQMAALAWSTRDPVCAPVLSQQSKDIAQALAVLIGRSERLMAIAHGGGLLADIARLCHAMWPLASTVRAHHVTRDTTEEETDDHDISAAYPPFRPAYR